MISESRTKIISWLKSPKNAVVTGLVSVSVISIGAVTAFAFSNNSYSDTGEAAKSNIATPEHEINKQSTQEVAQNEEPEEVVANETTSEEVPVVPQQPNQIPSPQEPEPEQPLPVVYSDTYPADLRDAPISSKYDQWGLDNRQSTSYTAWKVYETFGNMPKWGYTGNGNASNWPTLADSSNILRGVTPKVHSVGVSGNFTVWVESVDGENVDVSFYNWDNKGTFGYWNDVPASQFNTYIYFGS